MIKKQNIKYLNDNLVKAFDKISVHGSYKLIGSSTIKNLLYTGDYDLNEHMNNNDNLVHFFKTVFHSCYTLPNYYILDFKCGKDHEHNSIKWKYQDIKKGYKEIDYKKYNLSECLKQHETIKLDLCYILDNLFIEITNNYFINEEKKDRDDIIKNIEIEIESLIKEHNYFKALKRLFSVEKIKGDVDEELLIFLNSDYGRFYKCIHDLELVLIMYEQTFKPLKKSLLIDNLQNIKMIMNKITAFNVDNILDDINNICKSKKFNELENIIKHTKLILNNKVSKHYTAFLSPT